MDTSVVVIFISLQGVELYMTAPECYDLVKKSSNNNKHPGCRYMLLICTMGIDHGQISMNTQYVRHIVRMQYTGCA